MKAQDMINERISKVVNLKSFKDVLKHIEKRMYLSLDDQPILGEVEMKDGSVIDIEDYIEDIDSYAIVDDYIDRLKKIDGDKVKRVNIKMLTKAGYTKISLL